MRKVPIYAPGAGGPSAGDKANPTYSVTISDVEARENKQDFDKTKDAKRMIPTMKPDETSAASTSTDFLGDTPAEAREREQAQTLNQRRIVIDPSNQGREDMNPSVLDRQRSNDLEEVKNIMRRQSTVGRRKVHQQAVIAEEEEAPAYQAQTQSSTLSTVAEQAPQIPSYYKDNTYPQVQGSNAPMTHVPSGSGIQNIAPNRSPLQTQQAVRFRSDSNERTPTAYEGVGVPGNAFSQQQAQSHSPPRRPVPGMSQMKGSLQGHPGQG